MICGSIFGKHSFLLSEAARLKAMKPAVPHVIFNGSADMNSSPIACTESSEPGRRRHKKPIPAV